MILLNASIIGAAAVTLVHLVRLRRRVRCPALAAPFVARRQALLRHLLGGGGSGRWVDSHPRCPPRFDHHQRAGPGRRPPARAPPSSCCSCATTRTVLGPWVNKPWLNVVASFIVSILLIMSLILMATTCSPTIDVTSLAPVLGAVARRRLCRCRCLPGAGQVDATSGPSTRPGPGPRHLANAGAESPRPSQVVPGQIDRHVPTTGLPRRGRIAAPGQDDPAGLAQVTGYRLCTTLYGQERLCRCRPTATVRQARLGWTPSGSPLRSGAPHRRSPGCARYPTCATRPRAARSCRRGR